MARQGEFMSNAKDFQFIVELGKGITVSEAAVTIYGATRTSPELLEGFTVEESQFSARLEVDSERTLYVVAEIQAYRLDDTVVEVRDRSVQFVAVFTGASEVVMLSERSTVATLFCFARFSRMDDRNRLVISDTNQALNIAYGMKNNFVATDGVLSKVIQSSPNGMETNSYAMFNFLSTLVYYTLVSGKVYGRFTGLTETKSLLGALLQVAQLPFENVKAIYALTSDREQIFEPSLPSLEPPATPIPTQWTLTIKVNDSGAENFMIGGVGFVVFDKNDRAWIANNVRQGTPNSSAYCVILEPDGSPAPFSPLFGGGLLGAGFGVAVDNVGETISFGSFGWGPTEWNPQHGSIALFSDQGEVLSPPNGYRKFLSRVQGLAYDSKGNLWMCSWGSQDPMPPTESKYHFKSHNSAIVVYLQGDPDSALIYPIDQPEVSPYHLTFDVAFDDDDNAYVSSSGDGKHGVVSSVCKFRIEDSELRMKAYWLSDYVPPKSLPGKPPKIGFETFRQITVSPKGEVLVVGVESNRVVRFDRDLTYLGAMTNQVHGPWGITFDSEGTMFVANFERQRNSEHDLLAGGGPHGVTVIKHGDESTAQLMTLPTGGAEVTLANGLPLYGNPQTSDGKDIPLHSYDPLMRLTAAQIDHAGNLWACNNWKPSADIDVQRGNPGGDGLVIFVGVAEPRPRS